MAEPFVFHFRPGKNAAPEVMYMADVYCQCGLCGNEQYQRYYHATPFHAFTPAAFDRLLGEIHHKADYECENCGTPVTAEHVLHGALTYGFVDDSGVVCGYIDRKTNQRSYQLIAKRRLDPQEMPRWQPSPEFGVTLDQLDDTTIEHVLDRPFNAKLAWIDLFEDWLNDPTEGAYARIAPGFWIAIDESEDAANEMSADIEDAQPFDGFEYGDMMIIALNDSIPDGLATHQNPQTMSGRWQTWLPPHILDAINHNKVWADAYMSRTSVIEILKRTFDSANLTYELDTTEADVFFSNITTPGEGVYGRGVSVASVLRRAVYTGLTPGEAARLTAEEIVGVLLRVWK